MRRRLCVVFALAVVLTAAGCVERRGRVVSNGECDTPITVSAATDSTVMLSWPAVPADSFGVYFKQVRGPDYVLLGTVGACVFLHDPGGHTGWYRVTAWDHTVDGIDRERDLGGKASTVPVHTGMFQVHELNAGGFSGAGWHPENGMARTFTMLEAASAPWVDWYITDWRMGHAGPLYSVASPDQAPSDPGGAGIVPPAAWRVNGFSDPLADEQSPLPRHSAMNYFNYTDITMLPVLIACHTQNGDYGLLKFTDLNLADGYVEMETWFQTVDGLRLIEHPSRNDRLPSANDT